MMGEGDIQPWQGEERKNIRLAIGKLCEEASELAGICARIAIQGLDGIDPKSGKCNRDALEDEMSDVLAGMNFVHAQTECMVKEPRMNKKLTGYRRWFKMIGLG